LSLWALAKTYGRKNLVYSGPLYESMSVKGDNAIIKFNHTGSGLASRDGKPLTHFEIAGADKKFVKADAKIKGKTVVVSSNEVAKPTAVRFAWHDAAEPNLMNKESLPASPFRTNKK
jgi:sialate O-acetylesterase